MPQRPRSHELEDISIDRFLVLRPPRWAARRKSADYGVDLEFEIFGPDGDATGLLFYVQMRATDSADRGRSLSLTVEQLGYFEQLPVPTVVVRYSASDDAFYWQWHFNIAGAISPAPGQKSFTYNFQETERWDANSATSIERTLAYRKAVSSYPPMAAIGFRLDLSDLSSPQRYTVESGIDDALEASHNCFRIAELDANIVTLDITATKHGLKVGMDCITSVLVHVENHSREETAASVLYCAATLLAQQGLTYQSQRAARAALALGRPYRSRKLAVSTAICLLGELEKAVDLALLNDIHSTHDEHYATFIAALLTTSERGDESSAELRFFEAALLAGANVSDETCASVHYSIGNFFRRTQPARAVRHYNQARKMRPAYSETAYFLRELGACLFGTKHYRAAAMCYERAMVGGGDPIDHLHLGDTLFFSGDLTRAKAEFEFASREDALMLSSEAMLKILLCNWLADFVGSPTLPVRTVEAHEALVKDMPGDLELWQNILRDVDATNEIAHFNLAVAHSKSGNYNDALGGFLLCAFKQPGDLESWANAVICCQNSAGDATTMFAVLATAISLAGRQSYDHLRDRLIEQGAAAELLDLLDEAARTLFSIRDGDDHKFTIRALGDTYFDIAVPDPNGIQGGQDERN